LIASRETAERSHFPAPHEVAAEFFMRSHGLSDEQRGWLRRRGISDEAMTADPPLLTSGPLRFAHVVFGRQYFDFGGDGEDGSSAAFVVICRDRNGMTDDIAAFDAQGRFATLLGRANLLGEHLVLSARLCQPLLVCGDVWEWLRADRDGVVILDWAAAAGCLEGLSLVVETVEFGQLLEGRLTRPAPPIFVKTRMAAE
jgi:hypothetical protein